MLYIFLALPNNIIYNLLIHRKVEIYILLPRFAF